MTLTVIVNREGTRRLLTIVGVGPKSSEWGAKHFFEVRLTDVAGQVPDGVHDPLFEAATIKAAYRAALRYAEEGGYRLADDQSQLS
jgi:hypothetical protein